MTRSLNHGLRGTSYKPLSTADVGGGWELDQISE